MTREELRGHCQRQIQQFERVEKIMPVTPNDCKRYEEHKLILELLEQESYNDCISRDMALEKMADYVASGYADSAEDFEEYSRIICQLPPVAPQTRWIPVSERLPEYDEDIIITHKGIMGQPITSVSYFDGDFRTEDGDGYGYFSDVVAWLPLPKPYKVESEE